MTCINACLRCMFVQAVCLDPMGCMIAIDRGNVNACRSRYSNYTVHARARACMHARVHVIINAVAACRHAARPACLASSSIQAQAAACTHRHYTVMQIKLARARYALILPARDRSRWIARASAIDESTRSRAYVRTHAYRRYKLTYARAGWIQDRHTDIAMSCN